MWVLMTLQPAYKYCEFFSLRQRTKYWSPSFVADITSRNIFEEVNHHLVLQSDDAPTNDQDKFWWIHKLVVKWYKNMEVKFSPSWLVCVDESMVVFLNPHAPGWVHMLKENPS